jgi:hypothetical protein
MKVIDPGHIFELYTLDDPTQGHDRLRFVKREGNGYPGNVGHHGGTNMQEVIRALIARTKYLNAQIPNRNNMLVLRNLREALYFLEKRAAQRHGRIGFQMSENIELLKTCGTCGHIGCRGGCRPTSEDE